LQQAGASTETVYRDFEVGKIMIRRGVGNAVVLAAVVFLGGCATVQAPSEEASRQALGYQVVTSLTTEVGARLAGTPKEAEARAWAMNKMRGLGFQNVREETFIFAGWERGGEHVHVVMPSNMMLVASALGGSVGTPRGGLRAPVVLVESHDDLLKAPVGAYTGKIVYINDRMKRARDEDGVRKIPAAALSGPDADHLERLARSGTPPVIRMDLHTRIHPRAVSGNVIGDIVGSEKPEEIVLMSAHLDSWDQGTGAVDDGAGVAMAIASVLRAAGEGGKPKRTLRVVLYGAEEFGGPGGEDYAKRRPDEVKRHVLAAEADFGAGAPWRFNTNVPAADLPFFEEVFQSLKPLGIERGRLETSGGADIAPLRKAGVPVISIEQDGTLYFDLHHTHNDTLDKIDPVALELNVEAYARVLARAANR
jgi:hypothetical protein